MGAKRFDNPLPSSVPIILLHIARQHCRLSICRLVEFVKYQFDDETSRLVYVLLPPWIVVIYLIATMEPYILQLDDNKLDVDMIIKNIKMNIAAPSRPGGYHHHTLRRNNIRSRFYLTSSLLQFTIAWQEGQNLCIAVQLDHCGPLDHWTIYQLPIDRRRLLDRYSWEFAR